MTTYDHNPIQAPAVADEWTPVLNGKIFCSPRCGGECTKAEYDTAVAGANELMAMVGPGWAPNIWENLGWYYAIERGDSDIRPEGNGYDVTIRLGDDLSISASHTDPRKAVSLAIADLSRIYASVARAMASFAIDPVELGSDQALVGK